MDDKIDLENLKTSTKSIKIGELTQNVIDILNLNTKP